MRTILISAYACEPLKGSESGVGWNWVLQMAKTHYLHIITRANNKESIEKHLPLEMKDKLVFHYYDTPDFIMSLKKKEKGIYFYYICWQIGIIGIINKIVKQYMIDYSIHLTFGSVWLPTFLPIFKPEFIWGTLGGGEEIPHSFIKSLAFKGRLLQFIKYVLKSTIYINPFFMYPAIRAKAILCRTDCTSQLFPIWMRNKIHLVTDGAIEPDIFQFQAKYENKKQINLIITSRLIHTKNIITAIRSICYIPDSYDVLLTVVGTGAEQRRLVAEIERLELQNKIEMIPAIPRSEVLKRLTISDIYIFTSLKEACNLSLLEAMAVGLPIICLNWSGTAISTDDTCAIRLPVTDPKQMPKDFAKAICKLIDNPELRRNMGQAARERIRTVFNWEAKRLFMENLLTELDTLKAEKNV